MAAPPSTRSRRGARKRMTRKEKALDLLRRKRAGEVINESDEESLEENDDDEPAKGLYDTDSENIALNEFEDDEEGVLGEEQNTTKKNKGKGKEKATKKKVSEQSDDAGDNDDDMDSFVVDDGDEPLGVPDEVYASMPLEFTSHAHKPLREHFRDAIEWCVQFKLNPGFEKSHSLYRIAWRRLDDEVRGLADSKFASSAWKMDFYMALRARPYYVSTELPKGDLLGSQRCDACGRSGHPAK
jgi:hypothetical protein